MFLLPVGPFLSLQKDRVAISLILLNLIGSRTGWSLICWSLQLMSACVCVCSLYVFCICIDLRWLALFPAMNICCCCWPHLCPRLQWNHLLPTFSPEVTQVIVYHLPAFCDLVQGVDTSQSILALLMELLNKSCVHCFWGCWFSTI